MGPFSDDHECSQRLYRDVPLAAKLGEVAHGSTSLMRAMASLAMSEGARLYGT